MPELPELQALVEALDPLIRRSPIEAVPTAHFAIVKTATPPLAALAGTSFSAAQRRGKHLLFPIADHDLVLQIHLMTNGRVAYHEPGAKDPKGAVLAIRFADGAWLTVSEKATRKAVRVWLHPQATVDAELGHLGPEPSEIDDLAPLLKGSAQLNSVLRDQRVIAGIGRAYANEILHAAMLGPFTPVGKLTPDELDRLLTAIKTVLLDATERFRRFGPVMPLTKAPTGIYDVHRRAGEPCPRCSSPLAHVDYESYQIVYCPDCQTGGKLYADRRMSRLLK